LGINCYLHDSAAALVRDGEVIAAVREERFTDEPHTAAFPTHAISQCLEQASLAIGEVDAVAYYWRPWVGLGHRMATLGSALPASLKILQSHETVRGTPTTLLKHTLAPVTLTAKLGRPRRFRFVHHHMAHLYGAYFPSPFDAATVVSMDLAGEKLSTLTAMGCGETLSPIGQVAYPHSIGSFFAAMTQYLGFRPLWDEYKVMGLAGLGGEDFYEQVRSLVNLLPGGGFTLDLDAFVHHHGGDDLFSPRLERLLGPRRDQSSPATTLRFAAIARATQMVLEDLCLHVVRHAVEESGIGDVCLGGGVALNGVMINRLREELALQRIFVPPSPDDAGTSAGAALALWHRIAGEGARPASQACLSRVGPSYSRAEIERRVRACPDLLIEECGDWISVVAQALVEGEIVAWFQGPAEFGPRALGGRSILADPGDIGVRDKISRTVKDREGFRPFAASVVEESAKEYFDLAEPAPYMIEVCDVVESKRAVLPAVTHLDGTCRPQTVSKAGNPAFWSLLSEFGELSGYPVLLNTSLNTNGQPMVCTPEQALETFRRTPMTLLAIEGLVVRKHREDAGQAPLQSSGAVRD